MVDGKKYRAFISYSRADVEWARRIHQTLEKFRLPPGIATAPPDRRLGRFFRDDDEMGAATDLGATLKAAISESDCLIVVASPAAAKSKWVNEEVIHFKKTGREDRIFVVIVDGVPNASDFPENGEQECFPPALRFALNPDGSLSNTRSEPLGIDARKESSARLRARMASGLLRIPFDDLWRRDRRRRLARITQSTIAGVVLALIVGASVFWFNRSEEIRRVSEPSLAAFVEGQHAAEVALAAEELGFEAASKTPRDSEGRAIDDQFVVMYSSETPQNVVDGKVYLNEMYAGGKLYSGSVSVEERAWLHLTITYMTLGTLYSGEVPYTDHGLYAGTGGEEIAKFGTYFYAPPCQQSDQCAGATGSPPWGDYYRGSFVFFVPEGYGVYHFSNGDEFSGQFAKNAIDGYGIFTKANGDKWLGQWERNRSVPPGLVQRRDGYIDFAAYAGLELPKLSDESVGE